MKHWRAERRAALLAMVLGIAAGHPVAAQESASLVPGATDIAEIQLKHADSMSVTQEPGKPQVFQGHVDVIVVDQDGRESRLTATKVSIYYDADTRHMDRLVAEGDVVLTRGDMTARSQLAIYDGKQDVVDLLQDNYVQDPRGELTADRIRLHLESNEVTAEGNVKGVVYPKRLQGAENAG